MRRDLLKCQLEGGSDSGLKIKKEEEENAALASNGQQEQHSVLSERRKRMRSMILRSEQ